jgi:hypothetical protein
MMVKKVLLILVGIMMVIVIGPVGLVMGGEPSPPGSGEKIVGPTMWAVGICDDNASLVTLRVKKIEDCNVDTDPQSATLSCPTSASNVLYYRLGLESVFGRCPAYEPIITKVKNFKVDGSLVSFDAQINFVVPIGQPDDVCEE